MDDTSVLHTATTVTMVVLAAHERSALPAFFSSRTDISVLEHGGCVVAIVPSRR